MDYSSILKTEAQKLQEKIVSVRRSIHQTAETGMDTFRTAEIIRGSLKEIGFADEDIVSYADGAGLSATIRGAASGKCIALRADIDALPIPEETDLPFKANNGNSHSCGHDTHAAMVLGAAKLLFDHKDLLGGTVKLIFQPGEESSHGAAKMIAQGVLENPHVDAAVSLHCAVPGEQLPEFPCGAVGIMDGIPGAACVGGFKYIFHGKSTHGGMSPQLGLDPVLMAANAVVQMQGVLTREVGPNDKAVLSICHIEGGRSANIVPDTCMVEGTVRTLDKALADFMLERLQTISRSVAEGMRGSLEVGYSFVGPALDLDGALMKLMENAARKVVGEDKLYKVTIPIFAGEDFASFGEYVPLAHFNLSVAFDDETPMYPNHNSRFIINEEKLWVGSAVAAMFVKDYLD